MSHLGTSQFPGFSRRDRHKVRGVRAIIYFSRLNSTTDFLQCRIFSIALITNFRVLQKWRAVMRHNAIVSPRVRGKWMIDYPDEPSLE
jgi:hypothetical protein